jgi:hypothetical protein
MAVEKLLIRENYYPQINNVPLEDEEFFSVDNGGPMAVNGGTAGGRSAGEIMNSMFITETTRWMNTSDWVEVIDPTLRYMSDRVEDTQITFFGLYTKYCDPMYWSFPTVCDAQLEGERIRVQATREIDEKKRERTEHGLTPTKDWGIDPEVTWI